MDFSHRLDVSFRNLLRRLACWLVPLTLGLMLVGPAFAAVRLPGSGLNSVAITGKLDGLGGPGGGPPALAQPMNVRTTARILCAGSALRWPCTTADGTSAVQISWYDISTDDVRTRLERRLEPSGAWTHRQTIDQPITHQYQVYDQGLAADTRYCYRLIAEGSSGETRTSASTCVVTQKSKDLSVTRAQLRVVVANVPDAGTDGQFKVSLTEPIGSLPSGNFTAINTPRDDLEAGSDVTYELNVPGVAAFRDVTRISFGSSSTDSVCVQEIQLILNGNENNGRTPDLGGVVYERFYGSTASTCRWVGGVHGSLVVDHAELRAAPEFALFSGGAQILELGHEEVESRLEALIGTLFYERSDFGWDTDQDQAVSVSAEPGGESIRVHLDFEGFVDGPNPEIDIDFLVTPRFQATASPTVWQLFLDTHDMTADVDFSWWVEVLSGLLDPVCAPAVALAEGRDPFLDCISHLEDYIEDVVEASFDAPSEPATVVLPTGCIEPTVFVEADASIVFGCNAYQRQTTPWTTRFGTFSGSLRR